MMTLRISLGLGAVILGALESVVVQVSSACLTNKQVHWFCIYKKKIHMAPPLLHSCGLQLFEPPDQVPQVWNKGRAPVQCAVPPLYCTVGVLLLGNNTANITSKLRVEPGLNPTVTARFKVASVEGLDDPLVGWLLMPSLLPARSAWMTVLTNSPWS